jgi:hypothetical protein
LGWTEFKSLLEITWFHLHGNTTHLQVPFKFWQFPIVMVVVVVVQVFGIENNLSH